MDDEINTGAYNPDLVAQDGGGQPPPPDDVPAPPPVESVAQSASDDSAGYTGGEPTTDGSGGEPTTDGSAAPVPEDEGSSRKNETSLVRRALDALREQFGVGEAGLSARRVGSANPDHEPGGLPTQAGEEPEEQPGHGPTGLPTQGSMGQEMPDEVPGQPPQMAAQPPVPYTGQPGQPDAIPGQPAPINPPRPMQYLNGEGAEDNATRTARENEVASRMPPGTDMNTVRSQALNENIAKNGPEAAGAQLQNHRDQYNKFKAMAGAALDHGDTAGAASLYNDAHTFMPDGHKVTASPGANGGMNLNIQDLTGGKPSRDIQLSEDQFRELTHMRAGEFDHVFERGIDKNAADLARTPGMPRGTFDQAGGAQPGVAKQFNEPFQGQADRNQADIDRASKRPRLEDLEREYNSPEARAERMLQGGDEGRRAALIEQLRAQDRGGPAAKVPKQEAGAEQGPAEPRAPRTRRAPSSKGQSSSGGGRRGGRGRRSEAEPVEGRQETAFGSGIGEPTTEGRGSAQGLFGGTEEPTTDGQGGNAQGFVGGQSSGAPDYEGQARQMLPQGSPGQIAAMAARLGAQDPSPAPYEAPTSEYYSPEARAARRLPQGSESQIAAMAQQLHARDMNGESTEPFQLKSGDRAYVQPPWLRTERGNRTAQVAAGAEQLRVEDKGKGSDYEGRAARQNPQVERAPSRPGQYAPDMNAIREGIRARSGSESVGRPLDQSSGRAAAPGRDNYNAVARGDQGTTAPQIQRMQPTTRGQATPQEQPFQRPLPQGSGSTVSKGNYAQPSYTPGQANTSSKGNYLQGQGRDQGSPMGDAAIRPDPTSAENRAAHMLPNGTPEQLSRLADQFRATDRMLNDRLNAQVGPDPNAGNYRAAPSGMPASTLGGSAKSELRGRDLDLKERDIDRKSGQGDRRLDFLKDQATGKLDESMMRHLDQANGTNISNAIRAANAKVNAGIPLTARDMAALDRAGDLAITPASRPNMQGVAPPVPGVPRQGAPARAAPPPRAQPRGEWRTNTTTGERRWFPAQ